MSKSSGHSITWEQLGDGLLIIAISWTLMCGLWFNFTLLFSHKSVIEVGCKDYRATSVFTFPTATDTPATYGARVKGNQLEYDLDTLTSQNDCLRQAITDFNNR